MNDTVLGIAVTEAKLSINSPVDIKDALKQSMKAMKNFWLDTDDDLRFRAACGGVMEYYGKGSPEWESVLWELKELSKFTAFLQAARAGLEVHLPPMEEGIEKKQALGLLAMWRELKD